MSYETASVTYNRPTEYWLILSFCKRQILASGARVRVESMQGMSGH